MSLPMAEMLELDDLLMPRHNPCVSVNIPIQCLYPGANTLSSNAVELRGSLPSKLLFKKNIFVMFGPFQTIL